MEDVVEEPAHIDVLSRREMEPGREVVDDACNERMVHVGLQHQQVVVRKHDFRS